MNVLYINACVRENSRTNELAQYFLQKLGGEFTQVTPHTLFLPTFDGQFYAQREADCANNDFSRQIYSHAKQFRQAELIVVAAPYWDLSFPAELKQYFEHINVRGLTFDYSPQGVPVSLCKARELIYITTAGGEISSEQYGYGYINAFVQTFFGVQRSTLFKAECLDIYGADTWEILERAKREIDTYFTKRSDLIGQA